MTTQQGNLLALVALVSLLGLSPIPHAWGQTTPPTSETPVSPSPRLALPDLIAEVQRVNPDIQAARARVEAAKARIPQARALPDPMVSVGYINEGFSRLTLGSMEDASLGVSVSQEIPYPPKLTLKAEATKHEWQREDERARATVLDVIARLKAAYYDLFLVERSIAIVAKNKELLEHMAQTAEARYAVGQTVQQDVLRAHTEITILLQRLAQLEQQRESLRATLNSLLNRPPSSPLGQAEAPVKRALAWTFEQLVEKAQTMAPTLQASERMIERNRVMLDLAHQQYLPDFAVSVGYQNRGRFEGMWEVMVGATVPLYFRAKQDYGVREAMAGLNEAEHDRQALQQALVSEIKELVTMAQTSTKLIDLIGTAALPQARMTLESALASYAVGKVDFLTLLTNVLNVLNQELQYAQELTAFEKALASLERLVGAPL